MAFGRKRGHVTNNPVDVLRREWFKLKPRKGHVADDQLPAWFAAVEKARQNAENPAAGVGADYLVLTLLCGLRRSESARLTWDRVDLDKLTLTIADTKNTDPLTLPLSNHVAALLARRKAEAGRSPFVFPSPGRKGSGKPLADPRFAAKLVKDASGVSATIHDLRRTFISAAARLVPYAVVKTLVNHRANKKGDVTLDYVSLGVEDLRPHVQKITDFFLSRKGQAEGQT